MLTAKGIGGGGSAKVTNGILQEMYAAEGEIPAGTFVETTSMSGNVNDYGIKVLNKYETDVEPKHDFRLQINDELLFYITPAVNNQRMATIALINDDYTFTVTETGVVVLDSSSSAISRMTYMLPPVKLAENKVAILSWFSGSANKLYYQILEISSSGVSIVTPITLLTTLSVSLSYWEQDCISLSENSAVAFFERYVSGSSEKMPHKLYSLYLSLNSTTNTLTCGTATFRGEVDSYAHIKCFRLNSTQVLSQYRTGVSGSYIQNTAIFNADGTVAKSFTGLPEFSAVRNNFMLQYTNANSYVQLYRYDEHGITPLGGADVMIRLDLSSDTYNRYDELSQCYFLREQLILVLIKEQLGKRGSSGGISTSDRRAVAKLFKIESDGTLTNALPYIGSFNLVSDPSIYMGMQVAANSLNENIVMIRVERIIHNNDGYCISFLSYESTQKAAIKSVHMISGLTKSFVSETQKGQVWLLSTQEGEE